MIVGHGKNKCITKWKMVRFIICMSCLLAVCSGSRCQAAPSLQSFNDDAKHKVIYVIYDNSTSMLRDDNKSLPEDERYTTRWVEASYGVEALAAMMNQNDILRIYPISEEGKPGEEIRIDQDSFEGVLEKIREQTDRFGYEGTTKFDSVEDAAKEIRRNYDSENDYWIVIMTDGIFDEFRGQENEKELVEEALDEINSGNERQPISLAYIYISGDSNTPVAEIKGDDTLLFVPDADVGDAITNKMTNIANKIYKRVAIKSVDDYVGSEGESVRIELKIPVERVLVFTQYTAEKQLYQSVKDNLEETYEGIEPDKGAVGFGGLEESEDYPIPIMGNCNEVTTQKINTKERKPEIDKMKYRYIKGYMHVLKSADTYKNFKNQSIMVEGYKDDGIHSIDVYYKPAATVGVTYFQEGQPISHTEECSKRTDSTESCLFEGEVNIKVDIMANDETRENVDEYELLYPEDFQISLYRDSVESGEEVQLDIVNPENLEYRGDLEKGIYELQIITSWNEVYRQVLEVQDRWQPVELELYETDSIWLESAEKPFCEVKVRASSGGDASDEDVLEHVVDVNLDTENELFTVEKMGRSGNGIWSFRVTLKDPAEHDVGVALMLQASAETDYRTAESNQHEKELSAPIESGGFALTAEAQAEAVHPFLRLLKGETIGINYYCDGIELTQEQKKGIRIIGKCGTEPQEMQEKLRITDTGDIRLEFAPFYWFRHREDTVKLIWTVTYNRWNHLESQEVVIELQIQYLPLFAQYVILIILGGFFIWVGLCVGKRPTDIFIPRRKIILESQHRQQKIRFCRKGILFVPFWRNAKIKYRDSTGYYPNILVEIRRHPEGEGYEILNYGALGDDTRYRLNNGRISASNKTISKRRQFQVADRNGCWHDMVMKR